MGLTKIELIGFKSFADREVIQFEKGVTAIVGPNGCGKSNVSDAVRWVIGENSAKQMRGSSMRDVIFNGTETRKSQSYCEVSLFFDNKEGQFPNIPAEEAVFTRKLVASGENRYYINGERVKYRDIIDNFHDVGISKDGYSIIGQGKVADIMSSKPEDRRAVFEEAVGIAKTKKNKLDSEKSLERARQGIREHAIRVAETEKRLAPLADAASRTQEHNKLSAELKKHEINTYIASYESANGKREVISQKIAVIDAELSELIAKQNENQYKYNEYSKGVNDIDAQMAEVNSRILEKSIGITAKEGDMKMFEQKIGFLKTEITRLVNENSQARYSIEKLNSEDKELNEKKLACENSLNALNEKISNISVKINALSLKINETEMEQESAQNKALESAENLAKIMQSIGSLEAEQGVLGERQKEVVDKITELKEKVNLETLKKQKLEVSLKEKEGTLAVYRKKSEEKEQEVAEIDTELEDITDRLYTLNSELASMETKQNVYSTLKESYEGYSASVQRLMRDAKADRTLNSKIKALVATVISTKKDYEIAIETALGASAQNVITETPEDANYIISHLKKVNGGRVTCLPLTSVKPRNNMLDTKEACREKGAIGLATDLVNYTYEYEPIIKHLLGNTLICQDINSALYIAKKYRFGFKIVTLDGQVYSTTGSMTGGSTKQATNSLLSVENSISQIGELISQKRKEMIAIKGKRDELEKKSEVLIAELETLNDKSGLVKQDIAKINESLAVSLNSVQTLTADLTSYTEALNLLNKRISSLTNKVTDAEKGSGKLQAEKDATIESKQKQKEEFETVKRERDALMEEKAGYSAEQARLMQELVNYESELARIKTSIADLKAKIEKNNENISSDNDIIVKLQQDAEKKALTPTEREELEKDKVELEELELNKVELNLKIKQAEELREQLLEQSLAVREKKTVENEKLIQIDSDLSFKQKKIYEDYELDYEGCLGFRIEDYNVKEGESEVKRLRTRINFLGPINPTAPQEYEQQNEEYLTLLAQKEDMEKGANDIAEAVKILTEEMTEKFDEGFKKIRDNFRTIFKVLFGGGDADLIVNEVEDGQDPLDAGIEIKAQPPGKQLKSISLLSGGEQALTAIAILFSILRLRPLPFCVLDEIEAPLDDANVARFANYLKKFSEETQFIVITHKKPTMERADAMYGVTMPEKGISKTVSVKLTDVDKIDID